MKDQKIVTKELKAAVKSLFDSHEQELLEIGASNIEDFYYSKFNSKWTLIFKVGDDQFFDTKDEMIDWIKSEGQQG